MREAWADELATWVAQQPGRYIPGRLRQPDAAWTNLLFGCRLGDRPQVVATTTPKPLKLIGELMQIAAEGAKAAHRRRTPVRADRHDVMRRADVDASHMRMNRENWIR